MDSMKLRLLLMGGILIVLGIVFYIARGMGVAITLPVVGIVLLAVGVLYKPRKKDEAPK